MQSSRRQFLQLASVAPWMFSGCSAKAQEPLLLNGHIDEHGQHYVGGLSLSGEPLYSHKLPNKAHGFAIHHETGLAVSTPSIAGTQAVVFDVYSGERRAILNSREGQHFNGHGVFSPDGSVFYATANTIETAQGIISVWDVASGRQLAEFSTKGIGPHDLRLMPDQKTLVIANGGIQTHPSSGKRELNINTMHSSLVFMDRHSGAIIAEKHSPEQKLSIRHLDVNAQGQVLVACQYKGKTKLPPLVAIQEGEGDLEFLSISDDALWPLTNYTACGRITDDGFAAVTCPRGNRLTLWDIGNKKHLHSIKVKDVGGIELSPDQQSFITSANVGELYHFDRRSMALEILPASAAWSQAKWTNHMKGIRV